MTRKSSPFGRLRLTAEIRGNMFTRAVPVRFARCAALAGAILATACSRNQPPEELGSEPAEVVFSNESLVQADVYAVLSNGGEARRLGTVMAGRTETLRLGSDLATRGNISVVARLQSGGSVSTGVVPIHPGDTVHIQLPMNARILVFLP